MNKILMLGLALVSTAGLSAQEAATRPAIDAYLRLKNSLVAAEVEKASDAAIEISTRLVAMDHGSMNPKEKRAFLKYRESLIRRTQLMGTIKDLEGLRDEFAPLSEEFWAVVMLSDDVGMPLYFMYCPMRKAYWISADPKVRNPYYGSDMLSCGTIDQNKE